MSPSFWIAGGIFCLANLLLNALLVWGISRALRLCREPEGRRVTFGFALLLSGVIAGLAWPLLGGAIVLGRAISELSVPTLAKLSAPPLSFVVPVLVFRIGLRLKWLRTLLVWLLWRISTLAQAGLALLLARWALLRFFADELPPLLQDWLG